MSDKFDTPHNEELLEYIKKFINDFNIVGTKEELKLIKQEFIFCEKELIFWKERNNPKRYKESLKSLLSWLLNKYEKGF